MFNVPIELAVVEEETSLSFTTLNESIGGKKFLNDSGFSIAGSTAGSGARCDIIVAAIRNAKGRRQIVGNKRVHGRPTATKSCIILKSR